LPSHLRSQVRWSRPLTMAAIHVGGPHCGGRVAHTALPGVAQGAVIRAGGPAALLRVSPPPQGAVPSMRRSVVLSAAVAGVAALFTAACSAPGSSTASGDKEVEVALITSTSGPLASYGEQYLQGFEAGLDHATDGTGRVDGIKISLVKDDDGGDPAKGVSLAKQRIGQGVPIIAGT